MIFKHIDFKFLKTTAYLVTLSFLTACGGGGGGSSSTGSSAQQNGSSSGVAINGAGVNGPLRFAKVEIYSIDLNSGKIANTPIAVGTTNDKAEIQDLNIPPQASFPYLVKFTVLDDTKLPDGTKPKVKELRTILLNTNTPVYATILTTMTVDLANIWYKEHLLTESVTQDHLSIYALYLTFATESIKDTLGLGLLDNINIFSTPPFVNNGVTTDNKIQKAIDYRTASNASINLVMSFAGLNPTQQSIESAILSLTSDLSDGVINGQKGPSTLNFPNLSSDKVAKYIRNTIAAADTTADIASLLNIEQLKTGSITQSIIASHEISIPARLVVDIDNDGWPIDQDTDDFNDKVPDIFFVDTDGDGLADTGGINPDKDVDGDGWPKGQDPDDLNSNNPTIVFVDTDGDGLANAGGLNPDKDADGDGWPKGQDTDDLNSNDPTIAFVDTDGDGLANTGGLNPDNDADGDGWPKGQDTDDLINGLPDTPFLDLDGDGLANSGGLAPDNDDDGDGILDIDDPFPLEIQNQPPTYSNFEIGPKNPNTSSTIYIQSLIVKDKENDPLLGIFSWYVNNILVVQGSKDYLPSSFTSKGDTVGLEIEITDGHNVVTTNTATINIENSPPTGGSLIFTPSQAVMFENISVEAHGVTDLDNDNLSYNYQWKVNEQLIETNSATLAADYLSENAQVSVVVTVFDGTDSIILNSEKTLVSVPSPTFSFEDLPSTIAHKSLLQFNVSAQNYKGESLDVEVNHGPDGLAITKSGQVTWTPNEIMFLGEEEFHFSFNIVGNKELVIERSITVTDNNRKFPISRSGIEVPYRNYSIWVDDYDNDDKNEILLTDSKNLIYTLEYDGTDYKQDWVYPFKIAGDKRIIQVLSFDINNDTSPEIIVLTEDAISVIFNRTDVAIKKWDSQGAKIIAASVANIDSDIHPELAVIIEKSSNDTQLIVFQMNDMSVEYTHTLTNSAKSVVIGNVDTDPAKEIIVNTGHVFDG